MKNSISAYSIIRVLFVLNILFLVSVFLPKSTQAMVFSCEVSVSPSTTTRDTSTVYSFSADSASYTGAGIMWMKVTRPSGDFTITNASTTDWDASTNDTDVTFTIGSQTPPPGFTVYATSGSSDAGSADWTVEMSSSADGSNPRTCTGSLGTSINGSSSVTPTPTPTFTPTPDTTAPSISNVVISGVSDSSVTITWQTNESANSKINYGTSTSYGSSKDNGDMTTSHSLTLTDLSVNTSYHGQIQSSDGSGNTASSSDFTFATSQTTTTVTVTTTVNTNVFVTPTPTPTPTPDLVKPKVSVSTNLAKVFVISPKVEGKATDNEGVAKVEYSVDDGKNWATVDQIDKAGEKKITFSFTPLTQGDGNYLVKVRATDLHENQSTSESQLMIIDRLPPLTGGALFSIGPQVLEPSRSGAFFTVAGLTPKLTFSAVGGPTSIDLKLNNQIFPLNQNLQTRLWSGGLPLDEVGTYTVQVEASDGASNQTVKRLPTLTVLPNGIVSDLLGPVSGARMSVYYFDVSTQSFQLWEAQQYGQQNPLSTDEVGKYRLILPPGTYYISISSALTRPLKTNIFTLTHSTPITQDFFLIKKNGVRIGQYTLGFPDFGQNDVMMKLNEITTDEVQAADLVGEAFPDFNLDHVSNTSLKGKPSIISVLTTWLPQTAAQMNILEEVAKQGVVSPLVVMSQESSASVYVFGKRGEYSIPIIADPDGTLVKSLELTTLPTHYFLDRKGVVTKVVSGVLKKEEIEKNYSN